jgi:hypothetical protein
MINQKTVATAAVSRPHTDNKRVLDELSLLVRLSDGLRFDQPLTEHGSTTVPKLAAHQSEWFA